MPSNFPLTDENTDLLFVLVERLQPATTEQLLTALREEHGVEVERAELVRYLEWLRSGFPRRMVHAGLERWGVSLLA